MLLGGVVVLGLLIAVGSLYQYAGSRRAGQKYPSPGVMVDVDGQRLHVLCAGAGEPGVVFESGIAASSLSWTRVFREVAAFTRACAYDRAGLGWSEAVRHPRSVGRIV